MPTSDPAVSLYVCSEDMTCKYYMQLVVHKSYGLFSLQCIAIASITLCNKAAL